MPPQVPSQRLPPLPVLGAAGVGFVLIMVVGWRLNLQSLDSQIATKRAALKKLTLSGNIPPNQEVMDYLRARQASLEQRDQFWRGVVAAPPVAEAAAADPQLSFQEQFHEAQRDLERLAAARGVTVPEQLGFPKELPPAETVPRLLVQLGVIREVAALVLAQQVTAITSFKVEDPDTIPGDEEGEPFLTRLPVRVRLTSSLPQLMQILGAIHAATPLIDVCALRVENGALPDTVNAELLLARYLVANPTPADATRPVTEKRSGPSTKKPRTPRQRTSSSSKEAR